MATEYEIKVSLAGYQVGDLFAQSVLDVKNSVPVGITGAIDIQLEFSSVSLSDKGFSFLYSNTVKNQNTMSLKLATRIYTDAPAVPNEVIVAFVQQSLSAAGHYTIKPVGGKPDGVMSEDVRSAIIKAIGKEKEGAALAKLKDAGDAKMFFGYLQFAMNKKLLVQIDVDGEDGPQTQRAIFSLLGDYRKTLLENGKPAPEQRDRD